MVVLSRYRTTECLTCRAPVEQPQTGRPRRYCSDVCRQKAYRQRTGKHSFQGQLRERIRQLEHVEPLKSLDGCYVEQISASEAARLIKRWEYWGTMPIRPAASYGLRAPDGDLLSAVVFGWGSPEARDLCGRENREQAICIERGCPVPWAPPNAASFLISRACKLAARDHGWHVFFAYADPSAGEWGGVYQACNWQLISETRAKHENYRLPDGTLYTDRQRRRHGRTHEDRIRWSARIRSAQEEVRLRGRHTYGTQDVAGDTAVTTDEAAAVIEWALSPENPNARANAEQLYRSVTRDREEKENT